MEREGGMQSKVAIPHHQTLRCAQGEQGGNPTFGDYATTLTLTLSRAAGEGTEPRADDCLFARGKLVPFETPVTPLSARVVCCLLG